MVPDALRQRRSRTSTPVPDLATLAARDLIERAVPPAVVRTAIHQPVLRCWVLQFARRSQACTGMGLATASSSTALFLRCSGVPRASCAGAAHDVISPNSRKQPPWHDVKPVSARKSTAWGSFRCRVPSISAVNLGCSFSHAESSLRADEQRCRQKPTQPEQRRTFSTLRTLGVLRTGLRGNRSLRSFGSRLRNHCCSSASSPRRMLIVVTSRESLGEGDVSGDFKPASAGSIFNGEVGTGKNSEDRESRRVVAAQVQSSPESAVPPTRPTSCTGKLRGRARLGTRSHQAPSATGRIRVRPRWFVVLRASARSFLLRDRPTKDSHTLYRPHRQPVRSPIQTGALPASRSLTGRPANRLFVTERASMDRPRWIRSAHLGGRAEGFCRTFVRK